MILKNNDEILEFVTILRTLIIGNDLPNNKCYAASSYLKDVLQNVGVKSRLVFGEIEHAEYYHTWVLTENGINIDVTASQFKSPIGEQMPEIIFGNVPEWYNILCIEI